MRSARVQVFLRIRPLSESEQDDAVLTLAPQGAAQLTLTTPPTPNDAIKFVEVLDGIQVPKSKPVKSRTFNGLSGTFREDSTNADVFAPVVSPLVGEAINGRTGCCFAYGHTGSGKTHTILGYGDEPGLYRLASARLFQAIDAANAAIDNPEDVLQVQVRFNEIYNGDVYDLLNDRAKCFVREDELGKVHIRSATTTTEDGLVTTTSSTVVRAVDLNDLVAIVNTGLQARRTGHSNVHLASSRSHAVLEIEIVTAKLLAMRAALERAQAETTAIGHARDTLDMAIFVQQHEQIEGKWIARPEAVGPSEAEVAALADFNARFLDMQDAMHDMLGAEKALLASSSSVGGALVFVDLAGSEHAGSAADGIVKTETEQNECREINKSLSALQACFRAQAKNLASTSTYRSSKLTMVLRDHLRSAGSTTRMIATLSPSAVHTSQTIQTLQYAQLVGQA
ncbi:kinesin family protein [Achlya hypogyna]|uniref:Kinesin family protein n=1 Tax=Achlya hypogyna TaxID=1202772 RepID=A0A1V9YKW7_ACHHY|nr:kinesin family protein [Achlya hypogyna]